MKSNAASNNLMRAAGGAFVALATMLAALSCGDASQAPITPRAEYSAEDPGEWGAEAATHAPLVELRDVTVYVRLPMRGAGPEHYIEKIGILDENGIDAVPPQALGPDARTNIEATLPRPSRSGTYRVYARCNLHDLWTAKFESP